MSTVSTHHNKEAANLRMLRWLVLLAVVMLGLSFAAVPLYDLFCRVTGFAGTTQVSEGNFNGTIAREMGVRFDATISPGVPLRVVPASVQTDPLGTTRTVTYRATNMSDKPIKTTASFNVSPPSTGIYFNKIECFCFTEQEFAPYETVEMPVTYFVDPALNADDHLKTIRQITLSYTFHAL
jgi:cytochrome c oxidase assembly protein subunit 11